MSLKPISPDKAMDILATNNKLLDLMRTIKEIDSEHNGFITSTELDDILKLHYPMEFGDKDLFPVIKKFCSI